MDFQTLKTARIALRERIGHRPWIEYFSATLLLSLLTLLAHGRSLRGSWRWDDGAHLNYAAKYTPWQYFFEPNVAQGYSSANVAPWNLLFYDINLSLFGMVPAGHYAHLLLIVALGATLFYAVLRQWLEPLPALIGAIALLLGKPTFHIAAGLMHGHYATGFVFSMLSILGWIHYLKGGHGYWLGLSALAYLLATTCKEVYVPLVGLLPFLPVGTLRQRVRALIPFALIALAYMGWRYALLGRLVGGYSQGSFDTSEAIRQLLRIPQLLLGAKAPGILIAVLFVGLLCIAAAKRRLNWPLLIVVSGLILLPLVPLTAFPGINSPDRYLFVPWIALSACLAVVWPREARLASTIGTVVLIAALAAVHSQERREVKAELVFWDTLYPFALLADKTRQAIFIGPDDDGYKRLVLTAARNAADALTNRAQPDNLQIVDEKGNGLTSDQWVNLQFFEFRDGKMVSLSAEKIAEKFPNLSRRRSTQDMPLEVNISFQSGMLHWKFGPYRGNYLVRHRSPLSPPSEFVLPSEGETKWIEDHPLRLSFCHSNITEGTITCSPMLDFDFRKSKTATWHGASQGDTAR